jgi:formate hydrogenlyase transcriptional activator
MFRSTEDIGNRPAKPAGWMPAPASGRCDVRCPVGSPLPPAACIAAPRDNQPGVQRLLADFAVRCVTVEPDAIDDAVMNGLRQIAEALQLDRIILWRQAADDRRAASSHYWMRHPLIAAPDPLDLSSIPFIMVTLEAGEVVVFRRIDELPDARDRETCQQHGLLSAAILPVAVSNRASGERGVLTCDAKEDYRWSPAILEQLRVLAAVLGQALARQSSLRTLTHALDELRQLRASSTSEPVESRSDVDASPASRIHHRLDTETMDRQGEVRDRFGPGTFVGESRAIQRVLEQVRQVAATDSTVLLLGETGTGKELLATQLHELSARRGRVMVRVNCSAIPGTLMESELFGREKGAFTGALSRQVGRFELADRSTIFLDEIGDLPGDVQVKLLRVLEQRQIERLGNPTGIHVDVRIVAATHRNLEQRILDRAFREDLFYRLNVFPIQVPPLRERVEDIPLLVWRFVGEFSKALGKQIDAISRASMVALQRYSWPGNIRELRNVIERAMIVATGPQLTLAPPTPPTSASARSLRLIDFEREHIRGVLESCAWRIRGAAGAAEVLGLQPTTLEARMTKLGLHRPSSS